MVLLRGLLIVHPLSTVCQLNDCHKRACSKYYNRPVAFLWHLRAWGHQPADALRRYQGDRDNGKGVSWFPNNCLLFGILISRLRQSAVEREAPRPSFPRRSLIFFCIFLASFLKKDYRGKAARAGEPLRASFIQAAFSFLSSMPKAPPIPYRFPDLEHNGKIIEAYEHYGFAIPDRGAKPPSRILYAARDDNGERHWRNSLSAIESLIDGGFIVSQQL